MKDGRSELGIASEVTRKLSGYPDQICNKAAALLHEARGYPIATGFFLLDHLSPKFKNIRQPHSWCVREDGKIVDNASAQFSEGLNSEPQRIVDPRSGYGKKYQGHIYEPKPGEIKELLGEDYYLVEELKSKLAFSH